MRPIPWPDYRMTPNPVQKSESDRSHSDFDSAEFKHYCFRGSQVRASFILGFISLGPNMIKNVSIVNFQILEMEHKQT